MTDVPVTSTWSTLDVARLPFEAAPCPCVHRHVPKPIMVEQHHVLPKGLQEKLWGKIRHPQTVPLCSNAHESVHHLLDLMLAGKPLPQHVNRYHLDIARRGFVQWQIATKEKGER